MSVIASEMFTGFHISYPVYNVSVINQEMLWDFPSPKDPSKYLYIVEYAIYVMSNQ